MRPTRFVVAALAMAGVLGALAMDDNAASGYFSGNVTIPTGKMVCLDAACATNIMDNAGQMVLDARSGGVRTPDDFRTQGALTVDLGAGFAGGSATISTTGLFTGYGIAVSHASVMSSGDSTASPGSATINKGRGRFAIASGANSATITSSEVTGDTSTVILVPENTNNGCTRFAVTTVAAGSFTVTANANCTTSAANVGFVVHN
ncbi:MAG TPA: hypothetical protein VMY76_00575 [Gemmatimonadales bacterium]|nr:hypothetical protein [Gemmatimonadales bacterium]